MQRNSHKKKGFFLIEIVVASAVIATVLILLMGAVQNSVEVSQRALERTQAVYLLEEGAEALKSIRDAAWTNISGLTSGTTYYLVWGGSSWTLTTTINTTDSFTRTLVCTDVVRDSNSDIATTGTADPGTKACTITVTWSAPSGIQTQTLSLYIADIYS